MDLPPEVQGFLESVSILQALIWTGVVIGLVILIRKAWPVISKFVRTIDVVLSLPERLDKQDELIERVRAQVENSHTTNLRDELTETLATVGELHDKVDRALEEKEK